MQYSLHHYLAERTKAFPENDKVWMGVYHQRCNFEVSADIKLDGASSL